MKGMLTLIGLMCISAVISLEIQKFDFALGYLVGVGLLVLSLFTSIGIMIRDNER